MQCGGNANVLTKTKNENLESLKFQSGQKICRRHDLLNTFCKGKPTIKYTKVKVFNQSCLNTYFKPQDRLAKTLNSSLQSRIIKAQLKERIDSKCMMLGPCFRMEQRRLYQASFRIQTPVVFHHLTHKDHAVVQSRKKELKQKSMYCQSYSLSF